VKVASRAWLVVTLLVVLALPLSASATHDTGPSLRGFGTATIDGVLAPGEWDTAGRYDFQAARSPADGGGTVPATLFVMNDRTNLYLALRVSVANLGYSAFDTDFFPPGPDPSLGGDILRVRPSGFEDKHWHQIAPSFWERLADVADGGTTDGSGVVGTSGGVSALELAHPLNSADDRHDFSLSIPSRISFTSAFHHCVPYSCGTTIIPGASGGRIVVTSGTRVPPETTITYGPPDRAELPDYGLYTFSGADDVAPLDEITFECKIDAANWSPCTSPFAPITTDEGWHTLSIRALDEMLNADPSPAQRRWRTDSRSPSKPKVARTGMTFRFSAKDRGTPTRRLRFRCAIDSKRLHGCSSRLHVRLPARRHVLRVRAVDPAGNQSAVEVVRFTVLPHAG
jgi:hypothetical protein